MNQSLSIWVHYAIWYYHILSMLKYIIRSLIAYRWKWDVFLKIPGVRIRTADAKLVSFNLAAKFQRHCAFTCFYRNGLQIDETLQQCVTTKGRGDCFYFVCCSLYRSSIVHRQFYFRNGPKWNMLWVCVGLGWVQSTVLGISPKWFNMFYLIDSQEQSPATYYYC